MRTFTKILLAALVVSPVGIWEGMSHCYWANMGWCADFTPVVAALGGVLSGLFFVVVFFFLCRHFFPDLAPGRCAAAAASVVLVGLGGYYQYAEFRRVGLLAAVRAGNETSTKSLLRMGADPNSRESRGGAPMLWHAIHSKSAAVVQLLLDAGADPKREPDCSIYFPLTKAYIEGERAVVELLKKHAPALPCPQTQNLLILKYGIDPAEFASAKVPPPSRETLERLTKVKIYNVVVDPDAQTAFFQLQNPLDDEELAIEALEVAFNGKLIAELKDVILAPTEVRAFPLDYSLVESDCRRPEGNCRVHFTSKQYPAWRDFNLFPPHDGSKKMTALNEFSLCLKDWNFVGGQQKETFLELINFSDTPVTVGELVIAIPKDDNYHPSFPVPGKHEFPPKEPVRVKIKPPGWVEDHLRVPEKLSLKILCAQWGPNTCASAPDIRKPAPRRCAWVQ